MIVHLIYLGIGVLLGWASAFFLVVAHEASRTPRAKGLPTSGGTDAR